MQKVAQILFLLRFRRSHDVLSRSPFPPPRMKIKNNFSCFSRANIWRVLCTGPVFLLAHSCMILFNAGAKDNTSFFYMQRSPNARPMLPAKAYHPNVDMVFDINMEYNYFHYALLSWMAIDVEILFARKVY